MHTVERHFGGKLEIHTPLTPTTPYPASATPRVVAAGLTIVGWAAVTAARDALEHAAPLAEVMGAAQRAAAGLPPKAPPRTGVLPDGRAVEQGPDGLWRPVKTEDGMETLWELPGGGRVRFVDEHRVDVGEVMNPEILWTSRDSAARVSVARELVVKQRHDERPSRENLIAALKLVPEDADGGVVYAAKKGGLLVLGLKGQRGTDGTLEEWFVAAQERTWRTNAATAREVEAMGRRGESVVEIRRFMEAGGIPDAEPPLAFAMRERDAAERRARLADEGAAQVARRSRALEAERDELRQKLRERDADVKRVAVESYDRGYATGMRAEAARLANTTAKSQVMLDLEKRLREANVHIDTHAKNHAKKISEANAHIDQILENEKRLLDEITTLEQRPLCRTVTTVVRCKGGKVLERTVETQVVTGEEAAKIARADAERATKEAADLLRGEAFRVRPIPNLEWIPKLEWKDLGVGEVGQVLRTDAQGTPVEVVDVKRVGHAGGKSLQVFAGNIGQREEKHAAPPAVDMARVEAVVRSDLEATRSRVAERALFALATVVCLAGSVGFGVFVGWPMLARAAAALGWVR